MSIQENHTNFSLSNFDSLLEARIILETAAVKLAAKRRTLSDLSEIKIAQDDYIDQTLTFNDGVEENMFFHLKVMDASKNPLLKSLFMKIVLELLESYYKNREEEDRRYFMSIKEHSDIIDHIEDQDAELAGEAMQLHLNN